MAISLNSFTPNTRAESAQVNSNFNNLKTGVEAVSKRAFTWGILGVLIAGNSQGMQWIAPAGLTSVKLYAKTTSGSCSIRIKKNSTDLKASFSVSSTVTSSTTFDSGTISENDVITLDVLSTSSGTDLYVILETQVTSIV